MNAGFERLLRLPLPALRSVTHCLPGDSIARLWFTGDRVLQSQLSRGGVTRFEVEIYNTSWDFNSTLNLSLLSSFIGLETLIIKPAPYPTLVLDEVPLRIDIKLLPPTLRTFKVLLPIGHRTFSTRPDGSTDFHNLSKMFPNLEELDLCRASYYCYPRFFNLLPKLTSLRFSSSTDIDQELMDALPDTLQELSVYCFNTQKIPPWTGSRPKLRLYRFAQLSTIHWHHNILAIGSLPTTTLKHLHLSCSYQQIFAETTPLIRHCEALETLEINARFPSFLNSPKETQFFSSLPRGLKSLTLNYVQWSSNENIEIDDAQLGSLPTTLEVLVLAGFILPLCLLEALPCCNLKHLAIYHVGEPEPYTKAQLHKPVGHRFYSGRIRVNERFLVAEDRRYRSRPLGINYSEVMPGYVKSDDFVFRNPDSEQITADLVSSLPRSLSTLILPHGCLTSLESNGQALQWPPNLSELFIGEVPLTHISMLPQTISSLDIIFCATPEASEQSLPPQLTRLRCSLPLASIGAEIKFPAGLDVLDLAIQDEKKPEMRRTWSRNLPRKLRSLSVLAISSAFSKYWMSSLPITSLTALEIDVHCLGKDREKVPPFDSWAELPPHLAKFNFRINHTLPFGMSDEIIRRFDGLIVESSFESHHYSWLGASVPKMLRNAYVPRDPPY